MNILLLTAIALQKLLLSFAIIILPVREKTDIDSSCLGCTATQGSSFTVGKTVTVGASLDLDFEDIVAKAGITSSVSITTLDGETGSVSLECPKGPWTCALIITPPVTVVSGTATALTATCQPVGPAEPFTMALPEKMGPDGIMMGGHVDVCACQNFAHWADNGAPSIVCPQPCNA